MHQVLQVAIDWECARAAGRNYGYWRPAQPLTDVSLSLVSRPAFLLPLLARNQCSDFFVCHPPFFCQLAKRRLNGRRASFRSEFFRDGFIFTAQNHAVEV